MKFFALANDEALAFPANAIIGGDIAFNGVHLDDLARNASTILGFEAPNGDFGWLRVKVSDRNADGFIDQIAIIDDAYNNVAGASILAGQTSSSSPTPEPDTKSLALLAAGAAGVLAFRRRRTP